jgi:hypothetical protein
MWIMASKEECDRYADEVARRFEEFTSWAIANWPEKNFPLLSSDFTQSRREVGMILGSKLHEGHSGTSDDANKNDAQFVHMNPAPWP